MKSLRVAMPKNRYYKNPLKDIFPNIEIIKISSVRPFLQGKIDDIDAMAAGAEVGTAWTLLYPQYSVIVPKGVNFKAPTALGLPNGQAEFAIFMNTWLDLKKKNGVLDKLFGHWIIGEGQSKREPRWSVIRDVLHWID